MNNEQPRRRRRVPFTGELIEVAADHDPQREYLAATYPDVDEDYRPKWQVSDYGRRDCDEHTAQMEYAAAVLEKAADTCRKLAVQSGTGSPQQITAATNTLLHAGHKTEEVIISLKYAYPQRHSSFYEMASRIPEVAETVPKLLLCTDSEFILWMPSLPSKDRAQTSIFMRETEDLLYSANLPCFKKWHCDFVHCYPEDNLYGVLDVDNYHSKPILDVIARAMFANDGRDNFSLALYNYPTTEINRGFYIHVYKRNEKIRFLADFISRLQGLSEE